MDFKIKRRVLWDDDKPKSKSGAKTHVEVKAQTRKISAPQPPPKPEPEKKRAGNGHVSNFVRKLTNPERDLIRNEFLKMDGRFEYRGARAILKPLMGNEVTVWQICGFLSRIHDEVYRGDLELKDPASYFEFMSEKYPKLHARYMAKYASQFGEDGDVPAPKFAEGFPNGKLR